MEKSPSNFFHHAARSAGNPRFFSATLLAALAALAFFPALASAIGLSPSTVHLDGVLKGGYAKASFLVFNTESFSQSYKFSVKGALAPWAAAYPRDSFTIPAKSVQKVEVVVQPPADAANGEYKGSLLVETIPANPSSAGGAGGAARGVAGSDLKTSVTGVFYAAVTDEQKLELSVSSVEGSPIEEGLPLFISVDASNTGNVRANPQVLAELSDPNGRVVARAEKSDVEFLPTESKRLQLQLSTEQLRPGKYAATVKIVLGGRQVYEKSFNQEILEAGSLNRRGEVLQVTAPSWAEVGDLVKVSVLFRNSGSVHANAEIAGEVELDGKLVEVLSSKPLDLEPGEQALLNSFFKLAKPGRHVARVAVLFGGKKTPVVEAVVNANPAAASASAAGETLYYTLALFVLVVGAGYAFRDALLEIRLKN